MDLRMTPKQTPTYPDMIPCRIAFVGDCPEENTTEPFSGPVGRVLNTLLRSANIERADVMLTNVFDERPDDGACAEWMRGPEGEHALARLEAELDYVQPNVIVPMGTVALQAFTGAAKVAKYRGSVMASSRVCEGRKILPTHGPAEVMKMWKLMGPVVGDLMKAAREGERGPDIYYPKGTLLLQPDVGEVEKFLSDCKAAPLLSVDIETGWGCITCIGFAPSTELAMCVPLVDLRKPNKSYWSSADEKRVWVAIRAILADASVPKLGQNFTYDAYWLHEYGIPVYNYRHDTRLLHHALYPEYPKDLASMAGSYTDLTQFKSWANHDDKRDA